MVDLGTAGRSRCATVWAASTTALVLLLRWCAPDLPTSLPGPETSFDRLLVQGAAGALVLCGAWGWVVTTVVVLAAARGRRDDRVRGVPPVVRRVVLAACGVALVGAAQPALATPGAVHEDSRRHAHALLDRLPLPDRPSGGLGAREVPGPDEVVVGPGDSLWAIAVARLGPGASAAEVTAYWHRVHALNRDVVGPDPDLLLPGQRLLMPPAHLHR